MSTSRITKKAKARWDELGRYAELVKERMYTTIHLYEMGNDGPVPY